MSMARRELTEGGCGPSEYMQVVEPSHDGEAARLEGGFRAEFEEPLWDGLNR
jgi:hypothetical protein